MDNIEREFTADSRVSEQVGFESSAAHHVAPATRPAANQQFAIGEVMQISGASSEILIDMQALARLHNHEDPAVTMAAQVGSQIKIRIGSTWLLASIRSQKMQSREQGIIQAQIDFLGEGDEERLTGRIYNFRRGVTRYPIPGSEVHAATSHDLKQVYAADERAHVEIGTVYPTKDIRGALYVDAMLASISRCSARRVPAS